MKVAFLNAEARQMETVSFEACVEAAPAGSRDGAFITDAGRRFPVHETVKVARDKLQWRRPRLRNVRTE